MKKVLFVASEGVPFIKTGGLADVVGSLPKCYNKEEYDVRVILPKYMCMKEEWKNKMNYVTHFYMDLAWRSQYVGVLEMQYDLILVPSDSFGVKGYFRMAYCIDTEKVERSLEALRRFVKENY